MSINRRMIMKIWYIYTMEFYSTIKQNEMIILIGIWIELGKNRSLSMIARVYKGRH